MPFDYINFYKIRFYQIHCGHRRALLKCLEGNQMLCVDMMAGKHQLSISVVFYLLQSVYIRSQKEKS